MNSHGCYEVFDYFWKEEIVNNKLTHDIYCDDEGWTKYIKGTYKEGTKISKIINEVFKNDKLNTYFSDIIASNKITGVLEISIDPIEYLLMSCNKSGWSSCHTIHKFGQGKSYGCYSAGIFSYMCDDVSLIAFRHDGKLYDCSFQKQTAKVHSKNWRQMIWLSKDFKQFIASRQYPNYSEEITKNAREMLEERINEFFGAENTWVHTQKESKIKSLVSDYIKGGNVLHYNDMLHGYKGDLCYIKDSLNDDSGIVVGSNPTCLICGKKTLLRSGYPMCIDCE